MTFEELKIEAEKLGYKLRCEQRSKTEEQWKADEREWLMLRKQREELKSNLAVISKRLHALSTSITQHKRNKAKNIVFTGLNQGWAYDNILGQIKYALATTDEAGILFACGEDSLPELTTQAESLYSKYREEYYEERNDSNDG